MEQIAPFVPNSTKHFSNMDLIIALCILSSCSNVFAVMVHGSIRKNWDNTTFIHLNFILLRDFVVLNIYFNLQNLFYAWLLHQLLSKSILFMITRDILLFSNIWIYWKNDNFAVYSKKKKKKKQNKKALTLIFYYKLFNF